MFRFNREISNRVIHAAGATFKIAGAGAYLSPSKYNSSGSIQDDYYYSVPLAYSLFKENEVLKGYMGESGQDSKLTKIYAQAYAENEQLFDLIYSRVAPQYAFNLQGQPIEIIANSAFLLASRGDLTQEDFAQKIEPLATDKLKYASLQNLIDLMSSMIAIDYPTESTLFRQVGSSISSRQNFATYTSVKLQPSSTYVYGHPKDGACIDLSTYGRLNAGDYIDMPIIKLFGKGYLALRSYLCHTILGDSKRKVSHIFATPSLQQELESLRSIINARDYGFKL